MPQPSPISSEPAGRRRWAIPEGCIPAWGHGPAPEMESHDALCLLNTGPSDAHVQIMVYFEDREPAGPYTVTVRARRTLHLRYNNLHEPEPVPLGCNYASLI